LIAAGLVFADQLERAAAIALVRARGLVGGECGGGVGFFQPATDYEFGHGREYGGRWGAGQSRGWLAMTLALRAHWQEGRCLIFPALSARRGPRGKGGLSCVVPSFCRLRPRSPWPLAAGRILGKGRSGWTMW